MSNDIDDLRRLKETRDREIEELRTNLQAFRTSFFSALNEEIQHLRSIGFDDYYSDASYEDDGNRLRFRVKPFAEVVCITFPGFYCEEWTNLGQAYTNQLTAKLGIFQSESNATALCTQWVLPDGIWQGRGIGLADKGRVDDKERIHKYARQLLLNMVIEVREVWPKIEELRLESLLSSERHSVGQVFKASE